MKRFKMSKKSSKRVFRKGAMNIKKKNFRAVPMRGGFRI
ncbi:MAG: hypothetical protein [Microvirus sp.]|nr:MAG: hypothetical protein [Microvirus sp.]